MIIKNKLLLIFILIGCFLHFYNLNWGYPFYFHPDERNIASSVSQLQFPDKMNPNFFAYGSLPIYAIYFTGVIFNFLTNNLPIQNVLFENALLISRFYSAFFATLLIPILFLLGKKLKDEKTGLFASFFALTSVGFIQYSHFGTFEMWLTFFSTLLFWVCLQKVTHKTILLAGIIFGTLVAVKISSLILLPIPILILISQTKLPRNMIFKLGGLLAISNFVKNTILIILTSGLVYFLTNPFVITDYDSFRGSMDYESSLVIGTLPVFYTGEFFNTTPMLFHFLNIYPFLINPLITILFIVSSIYILFITIKKKNLSYYLLFSTCYLLFLSQAFFFAKWTRYIVPTLPFIFLIVGIFLSDFLQFLKKSSLMKYLILTIVILTGILFSISFFITTFVREDTRIAASEFAAKNIPSQSRILSEVYDMGIVPFNSSLPNIKLFNFYDLDNNSPESTPDSLKFNLETSDYIILPSQRLLKTRLLNGDKFPIGNEFYKNLVDGKLNYKKIYETPCDIFCKIVYLGDPVFSFEQTANVFDRPQILIFKKI